MNKKQFEVLAWASSYLEEHEREAHVAELLLQHYLQITREVYFQRMRDSVPEKVLQEFKAGVEAHALSGVPVQHLIGSAHFYGRKFKVSEAVLVPRFETEELVQHVIEMVKADFNDKPITVVDIGTGSGVIAITLALELPNAIVYAVDISADALQIARENAATLMADVTFLKGDFLQPILDREINPQIILSNPPYIKLADASTLSDTVVKYDPHLALFGGEDGLDAYRKITLQTRELPGTSDRRICYEIGYDQATDVQAIIKQVYPVSAPICLKDINENDRIISVNL